MSELLLAAGSAIWLGIMTSISPCPLASNLAAVSFIGSRKGSVKNVFLAGCFYAAGRMAAYVGVSVVIIYTSMSTPLLSNFLQKYMNKLLGPLLIVAGMLLLEMIKLSFGNFLPFEKLQKKAESGGITAALALGFAFALAFCPISAGLFFAGLLPLAAKAQSAFALPALFGVGTAAPVIAFAAILGAGTKQVSKAFNSITSFERVARYGTGTVFVLAGIYYTLVYIFNVL